ncbi:Nudix family hydrolase [Luteimonas sp. MC1825]|uniref:Nudix family hydrolase n=1 Tax=Luteimonas sp. MC1825 TaxID=2761107 RepID=UPI0016075219|nr:Nudix family hydrolase [Luteimonas sp. MC1825]MBB6600016.1 Nudix family hydrolase [Luteimonas sp. MC1825]QOC87719.1 Nudix family hydrolase [Luteimonas sp. MC1825]
MKVTEVVAGVLSDARGRVLLTRRTVNRDFAGLWEFPGGKREPGEEADAALARELHEELGINATIGAPLITVPQAYPGKRLRLDVRRIARWRGVPRGREGQALAWVPLEKLHTYAMPPADIPVVAALHQPDRYLVTPPPAAGVAALVDGPWLEALDASLATGIARVQLRLPGLEPARVRTLAAAALERCQRAGAELLVNGDAELARELGAGLHLRAAQLAALGERPQLADGAALAASCHDAGELLHAARLGCDFCVAGPVMATESHPGQKGIGWARFAELREGVALPMYAIGGMGAGDIEVARRHGGQGIAAIRGLWAQAPR